ncbi:MAG: Eco57I restriction-modification methylase domain-containing protein [Chloroflexi bacterium]|nr:Eco57I restriction-modification methylase domain-containing protein [Chloroflexota bacterium]
MNRDQAYTLVRQTFTAAFDKARFQNFTLNLLNHVDESKAALWSSQYVKDAFKDHVQRYERLGTYTSPEKEKLDVLIVHLTGESKLERARTALRNFVADHLRTRDEKDAALVAFVSPSETTWRFSYVKMEYATVEKDSGKVGVKTRLTPARRSSYIVGEGESCHTAQTRFLGILQDTRTDPALADIEEAFSVEAVTKEFFTKYAELFEEIHKALDKLVAEDKTIGDQFTAKGVKTVDFAKKLMGQIVFLYFLQKKGWLGVAEGQDWGSGPRDFLRRMADGEYGRYDNFFNDILEPLFYDTLATDRGHQAWCNRFKCRIPFLNGGLFEPLGDYDWRKTDIVLPNQLFTNREFVEEGIAGTGVLDVFDRYNFTVNEAEPLEKDVAIDPEMLGKVFENLIEENRRKGLGAYYTPREIVHYMCQQSLINYLDTALNSQPVIASEAKQSLRRNSETASSQTPLLAMTPPERELVPRADIETLVHLGEQISHYEAVETEYRIKMPKSIQPHARLIDEKLAEIAICDPAVGSGAFPVGMMMEIVRARSALTPYFNDVHERKPYHFKRHAIQNCLYGVDIDPGAVEIARLRLWLSLVVDEEDAKQIKPLPNLDYKIVAGNSLLGFPFKSQRLVEIEKLKDKLFDETDHGKKAELKARVDKMLAESFATSKKSLGYDVHFDFEIFFSEVFQRKGGFDIVIANPPYVRQEGIKELKPILQHQFECYSGLADIYVYFFERSVKLLRDGGALAFITSNKYFRAGYGRKLRAFLAESTSIRKLIDFGELPVFAAGTDPAILLVTKETPGADHELQASMIKVASEIERITYAVVARSNSRPQASLQVEGWTLENPAVLSLLAKLRRVGHPLKDVVAGRFYYGIKTGLNEAFVVDRATRDLLVAEHPSSADVLKPFVHGSDVKKWIVDLRDEWLLYVPWHFPLHLDKSISGQSEKAESLVKKNYPAIYKHLLSHKWALLKRNADETGIRYEWYALQRWGADYWQEFKEPKIMFNETSRELHAFFDERGGLYPNKTLFMLIAPQPKPLLAVLLSRTLDWLYRHEFPSWGDPWKGGRVQFRGERMATVPIPDFPPQVEQSLAMLVDQILAAKRRDPQADTMALEGEIDRLVYRLYDLTPEEIALVEESGHK